MAVPYRPMRPIAIAPAPPRAPPVQQHRVTFYDLPAELRIEIYKLTLEKVRLQILPATADKARKRPHPLTLTSHQVRLEVLPIIHATCPIMCNITDFVFDGLLEWMSRIPPHEERVLTKNDNLTIAFHTTIQQPSRSMESLRKWLHMRADQHRPQPRWQYSGPTPPSKICADLRRRAKRMKEEGKQAELLKILKALQIPCGDENTRGSGRRQNP
ncbi:hypothetical protein DOTSEDRAFT_22066 [Dothistroma septosporum NZE10]|uniref:Uncharacterized protein n=1 Tax=Dothistroma septosporum (strain NZE10 / CBS 128990) TaxID=675120 RepID=N1PRC8_DOTSN|nr:hypothetical protein DOTSEDRAFT_22066 [Dothistroma septosporum NZE10]